MGNAAEIAIAAATPLVQRPLCLKVKQQLLSILRFLLTRTDDSFVDE
jgi:hypothetical protein